MQVLTSATIRFDILVREVKDQNGSHIIKLMLDRILPESCSVEVASAFIEAVASAIADCKEDYKNKFAMAIDKQ